MLLGGLVCLSADLADRHRRRRGDPRAALILPTVLGWLGVAGSVVMQVLNIILIAFALIVLIWFCWDLLTCAGGMPSGCGERGC